MKIVLYIGIGLVAAYLGYKISQYVSCSKEMKKNIIPIVDELKIELTAVEEKMRGDISNEEKVALVERRNKILSLLGNFFGFTQEELNEILKTQAK